LLSGGFVPGTGSGNWRIIYFLLKIAISNRMEQKTTGTEITQISLASQMVYLPASRLVTNSGAGNTNDRAKLKTSIRGSQ